jgi:hypothetical protein
MDANSPIVPLHEAPKDDVAIGVWSGNDVGLVVLAVSHNVGVHLRSPCKQDLTSDWDAV